DPEGAATGHAHAAGYLVPLGLVGLLPWTPLLPLALVPLRDRPRPAAAALAAAWVGTGVVFFSLPPAKRSVYLLPLYPAVPLVVTALFALWSASFDVLLHPAIARERSLKGFFAEVARSVPPGAPLYALYPPDPGLRFYAPPTLREWLPRGASAGSHLLLWEDEWERVRDAEGEPLTVLAVSAARQAGHGRLALVAAPRGPLVPASEGAGPPPPLEVRTGNRSR